MKYPITLFLVLVCVFLTGCQNMVEVNHEKLALCETSVKRSIQVDQLAENVRKEPPQRVGTHTFTVFGIPCGSINIADPLPEVLHPYYC